MKKRNCFFKIKIGLMSFLRNCIIRWCYLINTVKIKKNRKSEDNNAVILMKFDGLGDFVLFMNVAREITEYYQGKSVTFCCSPSFVPYAEELNCFDKIMPVHFEELSLKRIWKTYKKLSKEKYDVLLHPTQPRSVYAEMLASFVNAKQKIASFGECGGVPLKIKKKCDKIYDRLIDTDVDHMTMIQTAEFLRGIGYINYQAKLPTMSEITCSHIYLPEKFFIVFMGASVYNKQWDPKKFFEIAKYISEKTGWKCVLCGADCDMEQERLFSEQGELEYYSFTGRTTLHDLAYIISKSKLVIGNDTCAIHIANAYNIQSICIKGHFSGEKFYPYVTEVDEPDRVRPIVVCCDKSQFPCYACTAVNNGENGYSCISHYFAEERVKCIEQITVDMVCEAVDLFLNS